MTKLASIVTITLYSVLLVGMVATRPAHSATPGPDAIVGEWWTEGKEGRFRFVRAPDGTYSGILVWGAHPGTDVNNKDPALRTRPLLGAVLVWHLRPEDGEYVDGYVYNPRNGETYRMKAELTGATTLKIRGYLGISLLGQSQIWTRAN